MSVNVTLNGVSYTIPEPGDNAWGDGVSDYLVALASGVLQKAGGTFTLTAEVDFGATFGLKSAYFKSRAANPASAGQMRLGNTESISWRNAANNANLALLVNASNLLEFNGTAIQSAISVADSARIDITLTGAQISADLIAGSVANSYLANMAANTIKGNNTGGAAAPSDLTATQVTAMLDAMVGDSGSGGTKGLVPAPGAGDAAKLLSGAGTWVAAGAGTVTEVALSMPAEFSVAGSPINTTGTLAVSKANQNANLVYAGPSSGAAAAPSFRSLVYADGQSEPKGIVNLGIAASVAANALTVALKQADGSTNPASGSGAVSIAFRSATAATGGYNVRTVTGALSMVVSSGSTLGATSAVENPVYIYAVDNAGTVELAVSGRGDWDEGKLHTTTAEGGAGGADSANVLYSTTARTDVPIRLIGRLYATEATAGTWATAPSLVSLQTLSRRQFEVGAGVTGATNRTNTVYGPFSTPITLSFTPRRTGYYRVYMPASANGATTGNDYRVKVVNTAGSATAVHEQDVKWDSPGGGYDVFVRPESIYLLTAGTSYTFEVYGRGSGGQVQIRGDIPTGGVHLFAEELW